MIPVPRPLRIRSVDRETPDVVSVDLGCADSADLPPWTPGAHVEVVLPSGRARQYSLCGDPADRSSYRIAVLRETDGRGGSVELHEIAATGRELLVRPPRNNFELVAADRYLFLAGGIGITPILPMIGAAERAGAAWRLVYGGRTRGGMAFLSRLAGHAPDAVAVVPQDEAGLPPLAEELAAFPADGQVYCCGPAGMITAVADLHRATGHGAPLHVERFTADPGVAVDTLGGGFEVILQRTGATVAVAEDQSILEAVRPVVRDAPFSCEEGYCGSCEVEVLDGEPDHRDTYLTDDEKQAGDTMMMCVSRARSATLTLDL